MKKLACIMIVAGCGLVNQSGFAAPAANIPWNQHQGFYAEANAGPNLYYGAVISDDINGSTSGTQGWGWNAALGYNFTHSFALEGGFMQNYAHYNSDDGDEVEGHTNIPYAAMRLSIPIGKRASFFGKIGGMYASVSLKDSNDNNNSSGGILLPYTGLGFSYALTPKLDATVQYQGAVYGILNAGLFSAGLTYHF